MSGHAWHMPLVIKPGTRQLMRLRGGGRIHSDTAHRGRPRYIELGFLGLDVTPAEITRYRNRWGASGFVTGSGWQTTPRQGGSRVRSKPCTGDYWSADPQVL